MTKREEEILSYPNEYKLTLIIYLLEKVLKELKKK